MPLAMKELTSIFQEIGDFKSMRAESYHQNRCFRCTRLILRTLDYMPVRRVRGFLFYLYSLQL
jgi:hypothetical protein